MIVLQIRRGNTLRWPLRRSEPSRSSTSIQSASAICCHCSRLSIEELSSGNRDPEDQGQQPALFVACLRPTRRHANRNTYGVPRLRPPITPRRPRATTRAIRSMPAPYPSARQQKYVWCPPITVSPDYHVWCPPITDWMGHPRECPPIIAVVPGRFVRCCQVACATLERSLEYHACGDIPRVGAVGRTAC